MYRVKLDSSDSESCTSEASYRSAKGQRFVTPVLQSLRQQVEKRKARVAQNERDKREKLLHRYPELARAKGDLGAIGEDEEDQTKAEEQW